MRFLQFYRADGSEAIGGASCFRPDGRLGYNGLRDLATNHCLVNGYAGYQLRSGESFRNSRAVGCIIMLEGF